MSAPFFAISLPSPHNSPIQLTSLLTTSPSSSIVWDVFCSPKLRAFCPCPSPAALPCSRQCCRPWAFQDETRHSAVQVYAVVLEQERKRTETDLPCCLAGELVSPFALVGLILCVLPPCVSFSTAFPVAALSKSRNALKGEKKPLAVPSPSFQIWGCSHHTAYILVCCFICCFKSTRGNHTCSRGVPLRTSPLRAAASPCFGAQPLIFLHTRSRAVLLGLKSSRQRAGSKPSTPFRV